MESRFEDTIKKYEEKKRLQELANLKDKKEGIRPNVKEKIDQLVQNIKMFANGISKRGN